MLIIRFLNQEKSILVALALLLTTGLSGQAETKTDYTAYPELSFQAFIQESIDKDPQFNLALQTYLKAKYAKLSTQSMAAWTLGAGGGVLRSESTSDSSFEPGSIDTMTYEVSVQKLFLETGTFAKLSHGNNLLTFDYALDPSLTGMFGTAFDFNTETSNPGYTLSVVQPLLKNAFGLADRFPVIAAELQLKAAKTDVYEAWENRLSYLSTTYLDWTIAYEAVLAYRDIVGEFKRLEGNIQRKVRAGVEERTELLRTRENRLRFQGQLAEAESTYRNLLVEIAFLRTGQAQPLSAVSQLRPQQKIDLPDKRFGIAGPDDPQVAKNRLLERLEILKQQAEEQIKVAENAHLPSLDLVGEMTLKGRTNDHSGGYAENITKNDYSVMLQAQYPLGVEQARGELGQARAGRDELDRSLQDTRRTLTLNLVKLDENLRNLREVLALNTEQLQVTEEKLKLDQKNYRIGRLDTFLLIDSGNNVTNALLQKLRTQILLQRTVVAYLALSDQLLERFPEVKSRLDGERKGK